MAHDGLAMGAHSVLSCLHHSRMGNFERYDNVLIADHFRQSKSQMGVMQ